MICPRNSQSSNRRPGAILVLSVLLLAALFIPMLAFSYDVGYMLQTQAQLQNAADSAALAGAQRLPDYSPEWLANTNSRTSIATAAMKAAEDEAIEFAGYNRAGHDNTKLDLDKKDIVVGYLDAAASPKVVTVANDLTNKFPDSIQVTVRRNSGNNNPLKLSPFASFLGVKEVEMSATAIAALTCQSTQNATGGILPFTINVNDWINFLQDGKSPPAPHPAPQNRRGPFDDFSVDFQNLPASGKYTVDPTSPGYDKKDNVITSGGKSDKVFEFAGAYDQNSDAAGNFGLLAIGEDSSNVPTFENWILKGPSQSNLDYLAANNNTSSGKTWPATSFGSITQNTNLSTSGNKISDRMPAAQMNAGPGLKSTLVDEINKIIGQPRQIPLFDPEATTGTGQNAKYKIVGTVPVVVVFADGTGNNIDVRIQPGPTGSGQGGSTGTACTPGNATVISLVR